MIGEASISGNVQRHLLMLLVLLLMVMPVRASTGLPAARDLFAEARRAACHGQPLVVLFGSEDCPYCHTVRELYLAPMLRERRYPGIEIREIDTGGSERIRDFQGRTRSMREVAESYGISLVPEVAFFAPDGRMLADSMVGIGAEDFYGAYLEQAIERAARKLRDAVSDAPSDARPAYACD